ncbi:mechanosensitive ion channel family protein [Nanoarchaeota archaeon]
MDYITSVLQVLASPQFILLRKLLLIIFILMAAFSLASIFNVLMRKSFERMMKKRHEPGHVPDTTKFVVLRRLVSVMIYVIGFAVIVMVIPEFRAISYSILAGAGVLAIVFGFAAQSVFANIMGGIFLATSEPIRVGDRVLVEGNQGVVEDITLRHVVMRTWDHHRVIIPNKNMNETEITNFSIGGEEVIQTMDIGISYDSDIGLARGIITEEVQKHPDYIVYSAHSTLLDPEEKVKVRVTEAGEFAMNLRTYFWAKDKMTGFKMMSDVLESVKNRFDGEGVEVPFPYRTIVQKTSLKKPKRLKKK